MKLLIVTTALILSSFAHAELSPMTLQEAQQLLLQSTSEEINQVLLDTPKEYSFFNSANENSVNYPEAVMHQVLINDSKLILGSIHRGQYSGNKDVAYKKISSFYDYDGIGDSTTPTLIKAVSENGGNFSLYEGQLYGDIYGYDTNLKSFLPGYGAADARPLLGWNSDSVEGVEIDANQDGIKTTNELYEAFLTVIANNASSQEELNVVNGSLPAQRIDGAHVTSDGVDLAQMSQKLLHGALSFYQATAVQLGLNQGQGLFADNQNFVESLDEDSAVNFTMPYTQLQHQWDMAFGYFGAARNYFDYSDTQIAKGYSIDAYGAEDIENDEGDITYFKQIYGEEDFEVSLQSEMNFGLSVNAAKRNLSAQLKNEDFSGKIMDGFLKGRQLLQSQPAGYLEYAQAYSIVAAYEWERVIASTVVHYINETIGDYEVYGTNDYAFTNLAKHFGEMKGFALGFQFNPTSAMTKASFVEMHKLMGDAPVTPAGDQVEAYKAALLKARDIISQAYDFDQDNVKAW